MSTVISQDEATEALSGNISRLLRSRGMSASDLARATGEKLMNISRIVRGIYTPNVVTVAKIAEALDVTIDVLLRPVEKKDVSAS